MVLSLHIEVFTLIVFTTMIMPLLKIVIIKYLELERKSSLQKIKLQNMLQLVHIISKVEI